MDVPVKAECDTACCLGGDALGESPQSSPPGGSSPTSRLQWLVVVLCCGANFVNQADRIVMSVAIVPMSTELHLGPYDQGWVMSSFSYGYILTQIVAGPLAERFGAGTVLCSALVGWCSLTVLTPVIAATSLGLLLAARVMMGICEGFCWPSTYTWISRSVDSKMRGRSFALLIAGGTAGQLAALLLCPMLAWPTMFLVFGMAGFVWVMMYTLSLTPPQEKVSVNFFESLDLYKQMLKAPAMWAILAAHLAHNWGHIILTSWLPLYLHTVLGVEKEGLWIVALPMGLNTTLSPLYGVVADYLHHEKGVGLLKVRRLLTIVGMVGPALVFMWFPYVKDQMVALGLVCVCYALNGCLGSGVFSNHADVLPNHAGMAFGLGNTIANIPGLIIGPLTGYLIANGNNWAPVFHIAACLNLLGTFIFCWLSEVESIEPRLLAKVSTT